ncbi:hypothetical protein GALMADRAFT_795529 [Galerina marginata CBS 339.88]|uniref:Transmembrane protein n=1 Tax=Galerina marginata (strain CBS 339.88) TaxID=685588 RepID=A0A067SNN7_GALM3|nr:hypothetical protein GALMADRAFT_795529 [Galerina marginata CBS 339.88]
MWTPRLWLLWFHLPVALGKGSAGSSNLPYSPGTVTSSQYDTKSWLSLRQVPLPNPGPTTSTYDFWWPFPAATPPPTTTNPPAPNPTILISVIPNSSIAPNSVVSSSTIGSSTSRSSTPASSFSETSSSSSASTPATTTAAASPSKFNFVDLVPAFGAVGIFVLAVALWVLYGCCTRRPRIRTDDGELLCGPPYVSPYNHVARDIEERGQEEQEEMLQIPKYGRRDVSGQYRWPSFNQPPPFDPAKGFYVPDEYTDDEGYFDANLIVPQANTGRSSSYRTRRRSRSRQSAAAPAGPSPPRSLPGSDSTSIALLELYESDEDEAAYRKEKETPWESLRHKSIKRGILEQVKKENKWMDSIRSSIAGGSGFLSRGSTKSKKSLVFPADVAGEVSGESQPQIGRRRGHVRADSDLYIDPSTSSSTDVPVPNPSVHVAAVVKPLNVTKPKPALDSGRPGIRRGFTWLKDASGSFPHLSSHINESRSRSKSRSRSASPVKAGSNGVAIEDTLGASLSMVACRDLLPQSPSQIMSPPLESQMCFTPMPLTIAKMPTPITARSKSKSREGASPTKIPNARIGRRPQSPAPALPSLPYFDGEDVASHHAEHSRGRRLRKFPGPDFFSPSKAPKYKDAADGV